MVLLIIVSIEGRTIAYEMLHATFILLLIAGGSEILDHAGRAARPLLNRSRRFVPPPLKVPCIAFTHII